MPSQMFAIDHRHSELSALSHHTGVDAEQSEERVEDAESASIIHCHVVAETMIGSSHGTRNSPRSSTDSGKPAVEEDRERQPDRRTGRPARPTTKIAVCCTIGQNCGRGRAPHGRSSKPDERCLAGDERAAGEAVQAHRHVLGRAGRRRRATQVDHQRRDERRRRPSGGARVGAGHGAPRPACSGAVSAFQRRDCGIRWSRGRSVRRSGAGRRPWLPRRGLERVLDLIGVAGGVEGGLLAFDSAAEVAR